MPYWIHGMLAATPALVWMFLGVGLPWALAALPRPDWRDLPLVACLTLAFGPALVTVWMFVLGSIQALRLEWILGGTAVIAVVGWTMVWRRREPLLPLTGHSSPLRSPSPYTEGGRKTFAVDEKLLIALIGTALVIRWFVTAYWPFTAYDALWVYGYQGRLYTLLGYIPNAIGYYPPFLPLQYAYLQLAAGGAINDHTARAVIPFLHLGSILATYVLGSRLFNRRAGIYTAAIWALYPHVGQWARFGDLEIPTAFLFTAASAFFLVAWMQFPASDAQHAARSKQYSVRYAGIAGVLLGIGLWTKPTMGAFVWGVLLMVLIDLARRVLVTRSLNTATLSLLALIRQIWTPRLTVAIVTGVACIPLGAIWYARNAVLGHPIITLPSSFWLTLAARSGAEFGWPLLALIVLVLWVGLKWSAVSDQRSARERQGLVLASPASRLLIGLALALAGALPSIITPRRMEWPEWAVLAAGVAILFVALWRYARGHWTAEGRAATAALAWAQVLALPYFATWFYSYSYHYRLSFAIVPLLILPTAVIVAVWTKGLFAREGKNAVPGRYRHIFQLVYLLAMILIALPGVAIPLQDGNAGWDWLWTDKLPDDNARYASGNAALMSVVNGLQAYLDQPHDQPLVVVAPGVLRLPFFFPLEDIRVYDPARGVSRPNSLVSSAPASTATTGPIPTSLDDLDGVTYFIYGTPETRGAYESIGQPQNQIVAALSLAQTDTADNAIMRRAWWADDGTFNYTVYELHLDNRFRKPSVNVPPPEGDVIFGGFARYLGHDIGGDYFWPGRMLIMHLYWEVLSTPPDDYMIYIHLRDGDGKVQQAWDGPVTRTTDGNYYSTLVWQPGEYIVDERRLTFDNPDAPLGEGYTIVIGMYNLQTQERVPITVDGKPWLDGYTIAEKLRIVAEAPQ